MLTLVPFEPLDQFGTFGNCDDDSNLLRLRQDNLHFRHLRVWNAMAKETPVTHQNLST